MIATKKVRKKPQYTMTEKAIEKYVKEFCACHEDSDQYQNTPQMAFVFDLGDVLHYLTERDSWRWPGKDPDEVVPAAIERGVKAAFPEAKVTVGLYNSDGPGWTVFVEG